MSHHQAMPVIALLLLVFSSHGRGDDKVLPEHFYQLSARLYSGATPHDKEAFKALYAKGVRIILSVDGAAPNLVEAKAVGLRYVHLPIGYSGVPKRVQASLAKLLKESHEPIYIHCHHGLHRGPTVAALMAILLNGENKKPALAFMKKIGTGKHYLGLWKTVREFESVPPHTEPLPLVEHTKVDDLTAAMVGIDATYDYIKLLVSKIGKEGQSNDELLHQSLLLQEYFRESIRHLEDEQQDMKPAFLQAEKLTHALRHAVLHKQDDAIRKNTKKLKTSCVDCHDSYRN